jgi:outer membrane receptor protein involved in Fe transport
VLVQRAYNPGGTTLRLDTGQNENFGAETLWDYELFARGRFAGGRLIVAGNLFYMAMRDAQRLRIFNVFLPGGPPSGVGLAELFNVQRARSYGAELTADWRASPKLSVRAAVGLLNAKITRTNAETAFFQGREFARSPRLTASGGIDWQPADPLRLSAQVRHYGGYFSDDMETDSQRIGPATIVDARASWNAGRATFFGYARNLFDTFRLRFLFTPPTDPFALAVAHDPREVGIGIESRF